MKAQPITFRSSRTQVRVCEYFHFCAALYFVRVRFFPDVFIQVERCCSGWTAESWESVPLSRALCLTVWCLTSLTAGERVALKRTENF